MGLSDWGLLPVWLAAHRIRADLLFREGRRRRSQTSARFCCGLRDHGCFGSYPFQFLYSRRARTLDDRNSASRRIDGSGRHLSDAFRPQALGAKGERGVTAPDDGTAAEGANVDSPPNFSFGDGPVFFFQPEIR